jgi:nucleotide-binding universal stress UspA family protein
MADVVTQRRGAVACMATHGRDRSAALLGSVAAVVLGRSPRPVLLAGPHARPVEAPDAPVAVAVDGSAADEALLPVALAWAARLARPLVIVTVAEPVPTAAHDGTAPRRARGPADPEAYLAALADNGAASGVEIVTRVVYDPLSVRDGLVSGLDRGAGLLVLGTHHRHGLGRIVLGSHAARVVHDAAIPALVVPSTSVETTTAPLQQQALRRPTDPPLVRPGGRHR